MTTRRAPSKIIPRAFPGIKPDEIEALIAHSQVHSYLPGAILCNENAVEDRFYMILDGEAEVTKNINNSESRLLKTLSPGDFFGEMALIHDAPRAATVTAKTPLTTLELNKAAFDSVIQKSTSMAMTIVSQLSNRLRETDQMAVEDMRIRAAELAEAYQKLAEQEREKEELERQVRSRPRRRAQPKKETTYKKFALIIGNETYDDPYLAQLRTPEADVNALAEILKDPKLGGFEDVQALVNKTSYEIEERIADFCADRVRDDMMLVYFSGHGILDAGGRLFLAARNTRSDRPSGRAISSHFLTDNMDSSNCKRQVLILDCCHSGAFHRGTKGVIGKKAVTKSTFEGQGYGRVVLTATDATQYAWENDQIIGEVNNSVFTHFLIEGLRSGAADLDNDGWITVDELYDYIYYQIVGNSLKQTPGKWSYRQQGKFFLASNPSFE
jgi:CRP-like cAMP-binding protein